MVSFIILHYMVEEETISCTEHLLAMEGEYRIVIVDNCSPNGSGGRLAERYADTPEVTVILHGQNDGFARGNNVGCRYARDHFDPDFYVVMNNDVEIAQKDFIERIRRIYEREHFAVLGPDIYSTSAQVHQSPKSMKRTTLKGARAQQAVYRKKVQSRILTPLKCRLKKNRFVRKAVSAGKAEKAGTDWRKVFYDVPLHGACFIFSRLFAVARDDFFFPDTWFYYESEILDYECGLLSLKTVYDPSLKVLHHQNVSTNATFRDDLKRVRFMNEQNYRSITAFLEKYDRDSLKIAMFGHKRIPSREGGVEIVVEELAVRMARMGHEVTVYNRKGHHIGGREYDTEQKERYKGVRIVSVPTVDKKGLAAVTGSLSAACRVILHRADVVHIHAEGPALMCGLLKAFGCHVVVTVHGLDWAREKWKGFAKLYIKAGEKAAVRRADQIIVLSEPAAAYFKETYGRETVLIPNGVTRPEIREADEIRRRWGLEKDSYVLFLGRIVPEKGLRYLLEAWKGIRTDKKLVIAGGGSDTDSFVAELKQMAGDGVIFTGFLQGRALEELYSSCYLYVLPSDLEGMPLSLLEALSYGNGAVISDIEECRAVAGKHGAVFRRGDAAGLRSVLQSLLDDPGRVAALRDGAAEDICRQYDWDDVVRRTLEVYRS